ncbi:MAG: DNA repair protein RecO [Lachnospiraceae bacterium]|nr:DNA repair protein RecO [Lachnospiraceae bacterium]
MEHTIELSGIVLSSMPIGENDKRIVILTKERGRISAFVRGAKRPNSTLAAGSVPMTYGRFSLYEGRSSYTVQRIEVANFFEDVKTDLEAICYGSYFLEIAEYYSVEDIDEGERLTLLYQSLRALSDERFPKRLIQSAYELKTMAINGEYPNVYSCVICGKKEELVVFSMEKRGCLCREHAPAAASVIDGSVLYAMQYIISTPAAKLYSFTLKEDTLNRLFDLVTTYRKRYSGHIFKSEEFLNL